MSPVQIASTDAVRPSAAKLCFAAGALAYASSFFLPAVYCPNPINGWTCAWITLCIPFKEPPSVLSMMMFAGGLSNFLLVLSLFARSQHMGESVRHTLATGGLTFIPAAWAVMAMMHLNVGVGHVLWVAGLVLLLVPEVMQLIWGRSR